jgi:hypothetical protein
VSLSTNAYCNDADVTIRLPNGYNTTTLTPAMVTAYVGRASRIVDAAIGDIYWPFNAITDSTNPTPPFIQEMTIYRAIPICYEKLWIAGRANPADDAYVQHCLAMFREAVTDLREGRAIIPTGTTSSETISWGAEPLDDDEHKFAASPKFVIPASVVCTGMIWGEDFDVRYDQRVRGSILLKMSDFKNESGTEVLTIASYDWSYKRVMEVQESAPLIGRVVRA